MDAYRHGIRVSALVSLRMRDIDVKSARIGVERKKGSLSTEQPLEADELRALKRYLKYRGKTRLPWLFLTEGKNRFSRQGVNLLLQRIGEKAKLEFKVQPHMLGMGVVLRLRAVGMIRG